MFSRIDLEHSKINNVLDVKTYFEHLILDKHLCFHPDDFTPTMEEYECFSADEAPIYYRLMEESFDVCEQCNVDIYDIAYDYVMILFKAIILTNKTIKHYERN